MNPTYKIFCRPDANSAEFLAFTWCRSGESGLERAKRDAEAFGLDLTKCEFRAEPFRRND